MATRAPVIRTASDVLTDAHVRLGFDDDQVAAWFAAAGLATARVETLEGGELTVKLWLGRRAGATLRDVSMDKVQAA